MIHIVLLILIYLAFISLGLPDTLLGVSWPQMREQWGLPLDTAGYVSIFIVLFTVCSGVLSGAIIRRLGTGRVVMLSGLLTSVAIIGISYAPSFTWLVMLSCGLGFGAGSVDTALNHYVALHFKAHHMNWLHCFWGVGASIGPMFLFHAFSKGQSWRVGYLQIGSIQLCLAFLFLITLPLWKLHQAQMNTQTQANPGGHDILSESETRETGSFGKNRNFGRFRFLKLKGLPAMLLAFGFYSGAEGGAGLWGSSYLVTARGLSTEVAALFISTYFVGITSGRLFSGFLSLKLNNRQMIQLGVCIAILGAVGLAVPLPQFYTALAFYLFGLGLAPMFPAMMHETPIRFGRVHSQDIIGYQIAAAYVGFAILPPFLGLLMKQLTIHCFSGFVLACVLIVGVCNQWSAKKAQSIE